MGDKLKRKRRVAIGSGAIRVSDFRQLQTRGIVPRDLTAAGDDGHPPITTLIWTRHARQRFAERIASDLEPELLYDYLKGRKPILIPHHVEHKLSAAHDKFAPYGLPVRDVCRVVLDWQPRDPKAPDASTRGVWIVVTVLPW